jgi:hypothetical protein
LSVNSSEIDGKSRGIGPSPIESALVLEPQKFLFIWGFMDGWQANKPLDLCFISQGLNNINNKSKG